MTYATQSDLTARFGQTELIQLTDRADPPLEAVDTTVLASALEAADGLINGYLEARYPVPLASVPRLIVEAACDIARHRLYVGAAPDIVETRYRDAIRLLEAINAGRLRLGVDATGAAPTPADLVQFEAGQRVFEREAL